MKKFIKPVLSIAVVAVAAFGAFAFTPAADKPLMPFGLDPADDCAVTSIECSTIDTNPVCKNGTVDLYDWNAAHTACTVKLYRK